MPGGGLASLDSMPKIGPGHPPHLNPCHPAFATHSPPPEAEVWYNNGNDLALQEQLEEAIACYTQALALDPMYAGAWRMKGACLGNLGRREAAAVCFEPGACPRSGGCVFLYGQAQTLAALGRHEEAIAFYDRSRLSDPHSQRSGASKATASPNSGVTTGSHHV